MTQHVTIDCLTPLLCCPLCSLPFRKEGNALTCESGHSFDIAKEGYVNLLTRKLAATVGDTKEMLVARRAFLDSGQYQHLARSCSAMIASWLAEYGGLLAAVSLLDMGCGEGYYLDDVQQQLARDFPATQVCAVGLDVSRAAIRLAAKRYKAAHFVVANTKERLPFADETFDVLLNMFAPRNIDEFARVLKLRGLVAVVIPTHDHLHELRSQLHLLDIEEQKREHVIQQFISGHRFTVYTSHMIRYAVTLHDEEVQQVVMMTPNYWHLTNEMRDEIGKVGQLETTIAASCLLFQKI